MEHYGRKALDKFSSATLGWWRNCWIHQLVRQRGGERKRSNHWDRGALQLRLGRLDQARNALKMNNHILRCRFSFNNTWEHWRQVGALDGDWEEGRLDLQAGENIVRMQTSCSSQEGWLWGVRVFTSHNRSVGWGQLREGTGRQVSNSCPDTHQVSLLPFSPSAPGQPRCSWSLSVPVPGARVLQREQRALGRRLQHHLPLETSVLIQNDILGTCVIFHQKTFQ